MGWAKRTVRWSPDFPYMALTSRFTRTLSTSVPIGWPQKQSSVTLNLPNERSPCDAACRQKILWPLVQQSYERSVLFSPVQFSPAVRKGLNTDSITSSRHMNIDIYKSRGSHTGREFQCFRGSSHHRLGDSNCCSILAATAEVIPIVV